MKRSSREETEASEELNTGTISTLNAEEKLKEILHMYEEKILALQKSVNDTDEPLVRAKQEETSTPPNTRK